MRRAAGLSLAIALLLVTIASCKNRGVEARRPELEARFAAIESVVAKAKASGGVRAKMNLPANEPTPALSFQQFDAPKGNAAVIPYFDPDLPLQSISIARSRAPRAWDFRNFVENLCVQNLVSILRTGEQMKMDGESRARWDSEELTKCAVWATTTLRYALVLVPMSDIIDPSNKGKDRRQLAMPGDPKVPPVVAAAFLLDLTTNTIVLSYDYAEERPADGADVDLPCAFARTTPKFIPAAPTTQPLSACEQNSRDAKAEKERLEKWAREHLVPESLDAGAIDASIHADAGAGTTGVSPRGDASR